MDPHRFDSLTRALAAPAPRRRVLRLLAAGAAGTLLAALGADAATAKDKDKDKTKPCKRDGDCPAPGQTCLDGACVCPPGLTLCPGEGCVDLLTSHDSCGSCENLCPGDQECFDGVCACTAGLMWCDQFGTDCVDVRTDAEHCGRCAHRCVGGSCVGGACVCPAGQIGCGPRPDGPDESICCDPAKCRDGTCRDDCPDSHTTCGATCCDRGRCERCVDGACQTCPAPMTCDPSGGGDPCVCPAGRERCGGGCCPAGETCLYDACALPCVDPCLHLHNGACVPICTDPCAPCDGVGACQPLACDPGKSCQDGACECAPVSCPEGQTQDPTSCACVCAEADGVCCGEGQEECGGGCVDACPADRVRNPATCGCDCAASCPPGQAPNPENGCACECTSVSCPEGQTQDPETCACRCADGRQLCDETCVDTATDPGHCGGCGTPCAAGEQCVDGGCQCTGFQSGCAAHEVCRGGACVAVCPAPGGGGVHNGNFVACDVNGTVRCHCNSCGTVCNHSGGYACCSDGCQYVVTTCAGMGH